MYRSIIKLSKELTPEEFSYMVEIAEKSFDNRIASLKNVSEDPCTLIFEAEDTPHDQEFNALHHGMFLAYKSYKGKDLIKNILSWDYEETDNPEENGSFLESCAEVDRITEKRMKHEKSDRI